jgi:hypothetical protein
MDEVADSVLEKTYSCGLHILHISDSSEFGIIASIFSFISVNETNTLFDIKKWGGGSFKLL